MSRCDTDSHPDCRPFLILIVAPQACWGVRPRWPSPQERQQDVPVLWGYPRGYPYCVFKVRRNSDREAPFSQSNLQSQQGLRFRPLIWHPARQLPSVAPYRCALPAPPCSPAPRSAHQRQCQQLVTGLRRRSGRSAPRGALQGNHRAQAQPNGCPFTILKVRHQPAAVNSARRTFRTLARAAQF